MRITEHPILEVPERKRVSFTFDGRSMEAVEGEVISSALFANGVRVFNEHHVDGALQGIFCANGQCAQCLVLANGIPVKACITPLEEGMRVESIKGLPGLLADDNQVPSSKLIEVRTDVLIVGAGPAGLSAAIELGKKGVPTILVDDKQELGGKLSLQTHNFFGSIKDCHAGTRGMDIGKLLAEELADYKTVEVWLNSPAVGVFSDKKVGVVRNGHYVAVVPEKLLISTGAREKSLAFPGCDLPGVYGAGAFQTLVNRDRVRAAERLFIVGGGNVGLIAAYHAIQAGIKVAGLVEALPQCGGYKVHLDKIKRLGVPVYTSHTVLRAEGQSGVEKVVISEIDSNFKSVSGTEKEFEVDTLLIAVGLNPVNELARKAEEFGFDVYSAGDARMISEASAAMFSGKIIGYRILQDMGLHVDFPSEWDGLLETLRSEPGPLHAMNTPSFEEGVYPVIRCNQEIPCNPCTSVCPKNAIRLEGEDITEVPVFDGDCIGCGKCVCICPGLAITLVDRRHDPSKQKALVTVPWELPEGVIKEGQIVQTTGFEGEDIGKGKVVSIRSAKWQDRRRLVALEVPWEEADLVAGLKIYEDVEAKQPDEISASLDDDVIVCRCERVTKGQIREEIKRGVRDLNSLKAVLRVGMGPCGGKTCIPLIERMFREEGVSQSEVEPHVERPFTQEVPISAFLKEEEDDK